MGKSFKYLTIRCFLLVDRLKEKKKGGEKCFLNDKRFDWHVFIRLKAYEFGLFHNVLAYIHVWQLAAVICYLGNSLVGNRAQCNGNLLYNIFLAK